MLSRNLLSLNLHCLEEDNLLDKQRRIVDTIIEFEVDIVFLQEVAQTQAKPILYDNIKEDNYAYTLQQLLLQKGLKYNLYYLPIKYAFDKYDEGVAFLSKEPMDIIDSRYISKTRDYQNWKSRRIFVAKQDHLYYATTHLGWSDGNEVFEDQVAQALAALPKQEPFILAGDFNVTPDSNEYQYLMDQGLQDCFHNTPYYNQPTHKDQMDIHAEGSKIDYMMSNQEITTSHHQILLKDQPVSDHYAIFMKIHR